MDDSTHGHGGDAIAAATRSSMRSRLWHWQVLARYALIGAQRHGPLLEIHYRSLPGVSDELAILVAAEARQCHFLSWALEHRFDGSEQRLVVRIEASGEQPDDIAGIAIYVDAQAAAARARSPAHDERGAPGGGAEVSAARSSSRLTSRCANSASRWLLSRA